MSQAGVLLDTCVFSELVKPRPDRAVVRWILTREGLAICLGVVMEVEKGIVALEKRNSTKAARLRTYLNLVLVNDFTLLTTSVPVARLLGRMMGCPELLDLWMDDPKSLAPRFGQDLHIAATAIIHGYEVATYDVDHFDRINRYFPLPGLIDPRSHLSNEAKIDSRVSNFLARLWESDRL